MGETLYERLGSGPGVEKLVDAVLERHLKNPIVGTRFQNADMVRAREKAVEFFTVGMGGPGEYTGRSMPEAHKGMNIGDHEFLAVLDDILDALEALDVPQREREEILWISYSMKPEIVRL